MELVKGANILFTHFLLRVSDKNNTIDAFKNQFSGSIIFNLARYSVELNLHVKALDLAHIEREEIKEQGPVTMGLQTDHLGLDLFPEPFVNIFEVGCFATTSWSVVNNFDLDDFVL